MDAMSVKNIKKVTFGDVPIGELFIDDDEIYLKVLEFKEFDDESGTPVNAMRLDGMCKGHFTDWMEVLRVEMKL